MAITNTMTPVESTTTTPQMLPQANELLKYITGQVQNFPQFDFNKILQGSFGGGPGSYFDTTSRGLMGALQPQFFQDQQRLQDQFRAGGMLNSTAYGQGMSNLIGQQGLQRNQILAQLMESLLGTSVQAGKLGLESAMAPIQAGAQLFGQIPSGKEETQNVDIDNMLGMLQALKGTTGGGSSRINDPFGTLDWGSGGGSSGRFTEAARRSTLENPNRYVNPTYDWYGNLRNPPSYVDPWAWANQGTGLEDALGEGTLNQGWATMYPEADNMADITGMMVGDFE